MQAIRTPKSARINALKMYRDDVDQLVGLFQEYCETVILSDDKYRYDSLDELKTQLGANVREFEIHGENPALHFRLNRIEIDNFPPGSATRIWFNELRSDEASEEADNLFFRVKDFLTARQMPSFQRLYLALSLLVFAAAIARVIYVSEVFKQPNTIPLSSLAGLLAAVALFIASVRKKNQISLETRANSLSFFAKNRDDFLKHIINTVISGLLGAVIGYVIGHLAK